MDFGTSRDRTPTEVYFPTIGEVNGNLAVTWGRRRGTIGFSADTANKSNLNRLPFSPSLWHSFPIDNHFALLEYNGLRALKAIVVK